MLFYKIMYNNKYLCYTVNCISHYTLSCITGNVYLLYKTMYNNNIVFCYIKRYNGVIHVYIIYKHVLPHYTI